MNTDRIRRARIAVIAAFVTNGAVSGSFVARIPDIKKTLDLTPSELGVLLFCASLGVLTALGPAGRIVAKQGSRTVSIWSTVLLGTSLVPVGLMPNEWIFGTALFLYGALLAIQDVAMNTHAITLEHEAGKRYMSFFHATFSMGAFLGGITGGFFSQHQISVLVQAHVLGAFFIAFAVIFRNFWLPSSLDQHAYEEKKKTKRPGIFWLLGLLGMLCAIGEGSAGDWGGVLARETFSASPFLSTVPFIVFTAFMVIGRLLGDSLAEKYGPANLIFICGLIAGIGLSAGLILGGIAGVILGWAALGAGVSIVIPMLFSAGGEIAKREFPGKLAPSDGVAMVGGVAYFGFMVGPPLMGFVAELITLRWAMLLPALGCIIMALTAKPLLSSRGVR